jgi:hypothetical protein
MGGKAEPPGAERLFDFPGRSRVDLPWSSCESAASLFRNMALDVFQPDGEGHATSDRVHSRIDHEAGPLGPWSRRLARALRRFADANGFAFLETVTEVESGGEDNRPD